MFTMKLDFKCIIPECGNKDEWYLMPLKEKVKSKDFIRSINKYEVVCKKCNKTYILSFKIKEV